MAFLREKHSERNKNVKLWLDPSDGDPTRAKQKLTYRLHELHINPEMHTRSVIDPDNGNMKEVLFIYVIDEKMEALRPELMEYIDGNHQYILMDPEPALPEPEPEQEEQEMQDSTP